ncbi:MAG: GGDEF domain-containing protein [bacterium]|nr:MAG: GGDEF domain-containing protein [bacterium]
MFIRTLLKFFIPGSIIFAAALFIEKSVTFSPLIPTLNTFYPYAVLIIGTFLGWRFSRSRLIFVLMILAFSDRIYHGLSFSQDDSLLIDQTVYNVLTFLIPLNIAIIAFIRERGIFTLRGLGRLGLLLVQPFFVYTMIKYRQLSLFKFLSFDIISNPFLDSIAMPQPSLIIYLMAIVFTIINFIKKQDIIEGGFFWVLLSTFLALFPGEAASVSTFHFATAGFILIMSVMEYSHNVAFRDELTGLAARRSLNEYFLKLPSRYSMAMVDIDYFKKFNDNHGHDVGDQVLRMVASKLSKVEGGGKAFRYGGEEFVVIFPGKSVNETRLFVEKLRKLVESTPFFIRSPKRPRHKPDDLDNAPRSRTGVKITISIGVAERDENHDEPYEVLKAADQALLRAKKAGRNKVRIFGKAHAREK